MITETAIAMCREWPELQKAWVPEVGHLTDKGVIIGSKRDPTTNIDYEFLIYIGEDHFAEWYIKEDLIYTPTMEEALEMVDWPVVIDKYVTIGHVAVSNAKKLTGNFG